MQTFLREEVCTFAGAHASACAEGQARGVCAARVHVCLNSEGVLFCYYNAVVEPGKPAWRAIVGHFGEEILQENGTINRERLGSIVFNDESKRKTLNRCTHPYIRREVLWELAKHFLKGYIFMHNINPLCCSLVLLFSFCVCFVCVC
jgi:hypothetical protein